MIVYFISTTLPYYIITLLRLGNIYSNCYLHFETVHNSARILVAAVLTRLKTNLFDRDANIEHCCAILLMLYINPSCQSIFQRTCRRAVR